MSDIRVAVVDDQQMIRGGLWLMIDHEPGMRVIGEAADGEQAIALVADHRPDVVVMDIRMPVLDGIEATRRILERWPQTAVLILTTFDDDEYVFGALRSGAAGFLLKDSRPNEFLAAIRAVREGGALVAPTVTRRLIESWTALESNATRPVARPAESTGLTEREHEILVELARGYSNRELAAAFHLSEATVKTHVSNLLAKLGLRSRVQAVIHAYESGLVRPGQEHDPPHA